MPLYKTITHNTSTTIYIWKIEETFENLFDEVGLKNTSLIRINNMKSEMHKQGFLSVRKLLQEAGYSDFDLNYDPDGKPHLKPNSHHIEPVEISITHSHQFAAIIISNQPVGIDIEILKPKTLKIASRFMDVLHLENLSESEKIKKATVIWGIKESIFKIKNEAGISFLDHIFETPFIFKDKTTTATLKFMNKEEPFQIQFDLVENYILVWALKKN